MRTWAGTYRFIPSTAELWRLSSTRNPRLSARGFTVYSVRLTLYNALGQKVRTLYRGTPPAGEVQTTRLSSRQLSELASGVYFPRLPADGRTRTQRLTVVR